MNNRATGPGSEAALLGLTGEVTTEDLQALLGRDPQSNIVASPFVKSVTSSGTAVRAVAGFDATLSSTKSLSVVGADR